MRHKCDLRSGTERKSHLLVFEFVFSIGKPQVVHYDGIYSGGPKFSIIFILSEEVKSEYTIRFHLISIAVSNNKFII